MSFCINTAPLVAIRSFAAAEAHFNNTAPIRGYDKDAEGVPLRRDRKNWRSMRLMKRPYGYAARLYHTDVVQWHADGTMRVDASYSSRSTNVFATLYLPYDMFVSSMYGKSVLRCAQGVFPLVYGEIRLTLCKDDTKMTAWRVDTASVPTMCYPKLNLKRAAAARKQLAPLMAYLTTLEAMGPLSSEAVHAMYGDHSKTYVTYAHDMVDPEKFAAVAARHYRSWFYRSTGTTANKLDSNAKVTLTKLFYEMTGCYDTILLDTGTTHPKMRKFEGE